MQRNHLSFCLLAAKNLMLEQTVRLFIKALIIGVLVNVGLQQISTGPLPDNENSAHQRSAPHQMP
jgi:hypothetical protein